MPIDIALLRSEYGGDPLNAICSQKVRDIDIPDLVSGIVELDQDLRKKRREWEVSIREIRHFGEKQRDKPADEVSYSCEIRALRAASKAMKKSVTILEDRFNKQLADIGNIVSELNAVLLDSLQCLCLSKEVQATATDMKNVWDGGSTCLLSAHYKSMLKTLHVGSTASLNLIRNSWFGESTELPRLYCRPMSTFNDDKEKTSELSLVCAGDIWHSDYAVFAILQRAICLLRRADPAVMCSVNHVPPKRLCKEWSYAVELVLCNGDAILTVANGTDYWCRASNIRSGPRKMKYVNGKKKFAHLVQVLIHRRDYWNTLLLALPIERSGLFGSINLEPLTAAQRVIKEIAQKEADERAEPCLDINLNSFDAVQLHNLESWLRANSFVEGCTPSAHDMVTRRALQISCLKTPPVQFPHTNRWLRSIVSFVN